MAEDGFRWDEERVAANEAFADALSKKHLRETVFNEKFADGLEKRKDAIYQENRRYSTVQRLAFAALVVSLLLGETSVSVFGISTKPYNLREFLLLVASGSQLARLLNEIVLQDLYDALRVYIKKAAGSDAAVLRVLQLRYGIAAMRALPNVAGKKLSRGQKVTFSLVSIGFIGIFLVGLFGMIALQIAALVSIFYYPTVSIWLSIIVLFFVVSVDVLEFALRSVLGLGPTARVP